MKKLKPKTLEHRFCRQKNTNFVQQRLVCVKDLCIKKCIEKRGKHTTTVHTAPVIAPTLPPRRITHDVWIHCCLLAVVCFTTICCRHGASLTMHGSTTSHDAQIRHTSSMPYAWSMPPSYDPPRVDLLPPQGINHNAWICHCHLYSNLCTPRPWERNLSSLIASDCNGVSFLFQLVVAGDIFYGVEVGPRSMHTEDFIGEGFKGFHRRRVQRKEKGRVKEEEK